MILKFDKSYYRNDDKIVYDMAKMIEKVIKKNSNEETIDKSLFEIRLKICK